MILDTIARVLRDKKRERKQRRETQRTLRQILHVLVSIEDCLVNGEPKVGRVLAREPIVDPFDLPPVEAPSSIIFDTEVDAAVQREMARIQGTLADAKQIVLAWCNAPADERTDVLRSLNATTIEGLSRVGLLGAFKLWAPTPLPAEHWPSDTPEGHPITVEQAAQGFRAYCSINGINIPYVVE